MTINLTPNEKEIVKWLAKKVWSRSTGKVFSVTNWIEGKGSGTIAFARARYPIKNAPNITWLELQNLVSTRMLYERNGDYEITERALEAVAYNFEINAEEVVASHDPIDEESFLKELRSLAHDKGYGYELMLVTVPGYPNRCRVESMLDDQPETIIAGTQGVINTLVEDGLLVSAGNSRYRLRTKKITKPNFEELGKSPHEDVDLIQLNRVALSRKLEEYFNLSELKQLCFELHIEYENLPGEETKKDKSRELVQLMRRQGLLLQLLIAAVKVRPNRDWYGL